MPRGTDYEYQSNLDRRAMLAGVGIGVSGLAGCQGVQEPENTATDRENTQLPAVSTSRQTTGQPTAMIKRGGWPTLGSHQGPKSLNPLTGTHKLLEQTLFSFGSWLHPHTLEPTPAGYRDWELKVANVGTSSPTLIAHLRDDMSFTDGTAVTAEDAKFTVDYIKEQEVAGRYTASKFDSVESITVDHPEGTTVNYFFSQKDAGWFLNILGQILLPKHIWKHVSNYQKYTPRTSSEGVVGAGPFELADFSWENWFELKLRADELWETEATYTDWFHEEAPFLDGVRLELFGSEDRVRQAVFDGDVDAGFRSFPVDIAVEAVQRDDLEVKRTPSAGWDNHSYNLRRTPLDDRAFRQFLVLTVDKEWIVEELNQGIGASEGTYATPKLYTDWRPPEPGEQTEYQGIPTPTLAFPGQRGRFRMDSEGIEEARRFLTEHTEPAYEYSWADGESDHVTSPDGKILHIDGVPFEEAHTDNEGNTGQGPLEVSFNPPGEDLDESRIGQRWVEILRRVGVPTEPTVQSFQSQVSRAFAKEQFDVVSINWNSIPNINTHYSLLFGSQGADLDGDIDAPMLNPMGYTGADALIEQQQSMMRIEPRIPVVKEILATIWNDAPTNVLKHGNKLQPVNTRWDGWIQTIGGILNVHSLLNLRQRPDG